MTSPSPRTMASKRSATPPVADAKPYLDRAEVVTGKVRSQRTAPKESSQTRSAKVTWPAMALRSAPAVWRIWTAGVLVSTARKAKAPARASALTERVIHHRMRRACSRVTLNPSFDQCTHNMSCESQNTNFGRNCADPEQNHWALFWHRDEITSPLAPQPRGPKRNKFSGDPHERGKHSARNHRLIMRRNPCLRGLPDAGCGHQ